MKIKDLMTRDVVSVTPETTLKEVARLLVKHRIAGVPVCDRDGQVLGVVSESDIVLKEGALAEPRRRPTSPKAAARTAREAMTAPAVTTTPLRTVAEAARLMVERDVNRLPVVRGDKLVGIVTRADLVRAFKRTDRDIEREIREDVIDDTLWLPAHDLQVTVESGEVALRGRLQARSDALLLERFVARVPGVVGVRSELAWEVDDRLARRRAPAVTG